MQGLRPTESRGPEGLVVGCSTRAGVNGACSFAGALFHVVPAGAAFVRLTAAHKPAAPAAPVTMQTLCLPAGLWLLLPPAAALLASSV